MLGEEDIVWTEEYELGVPLIDDAHRNLFQVARRLAVLAHDPRRHRWVAEEGIKYLKKYVVSHFAEEEAYMRSIRYEHLANHAEQHTTLREKILPRMESRLRAEKFSEEAVEHFLELVKLWISRHILVHDLEIVRVQRQVKVANL